MIRTVQKSLCELPKANAVEARDTTDDDDCVYVSPDEAENGSSLHFCFENSKKILKIFFFPLLKF